jgi:thiamine biosynthesis lipoprotein
MGAEARILLYAASAARADAAAAAAFARIAALDSILSDYRLDSELTRVSAAAGGPAVRVGNDLCFVLGHALAFARASDGAFDPTAGPLVALWRRAREHATLPDPDTLAHAMRRTGWRHVWLDPRACTVRLAQSGMRLDLGAIAKGHAVDEAMRVLRGYHVERALVSLGGEIRAAAAPPGLPGWRVRTGDDDSAQRMLLLADAAISTSADTEQFVIIDRIRYSHVLDARTGMPLTHRARATVRAPDALTADALATILTILEPARHDPLMLAFPGAAIVAYSRNERP